MRRILVARCDENLAKAVAVVVGRPKLPVGCSARRQQRLEAGGDFFSRLMAGERREREVATAAHHGDVLGIPTYLFLLALSTTVRGKRGNVNLIGDPEVAKAASRCVFGCFLATLSATPVATAPCTAAQHSKKNMVLDKVLSHAPSFHRAITTRVAKNAHLLGASS